MSVSFDGEKFERNFLLLSRPIVFDVLGVEDGVEGGEKDNLEEAWGQVKE